MTRKAYIRAVSQISVQRPLSEEWMTNPVSLTGNYMRCQEPDYKPFFTPMQARRMGRLMKRALAVSKDVLGKAEMERPDAIITATGLGCMENTELFLGKMCESGETMLPPTEFMQSTHNTVSSMLAINLCCHGYNCTYSHGDISFESALLDALTRIRLGLSDTVLVGAHDETTAQTYTVLRNAGYFTDDCTASEASVAMLLSSSPEGALCELSEVRLLHRKVGAELPVGPQRLDDELPEGPMTDRNPTLPERAISRGDAERIFGRSMAVSALGVYMAALYGSDAVNDIGSDCAIVKLLRHA